MTVSAGMRLALNSSRISGIDTARGLAVLGMFAAHLVQPGPLVISDPGTWAGIVDGRSSILFAVLAGVSIAIISGRRHPVEGTDLLAARLRIFSRAVMIFALGGILTLLDTGIAVILEYYAVLFVLALPFLRWRPRNLFVLAGALAVTAPFVQTGLAQFLQANDADSMITTLLITGTYPALVWIVFVLVGLGIGRLDLTNRAVQLVMLTVGMGLTVVGYSIGALLTPIWGMPEENVALGGFLWQALFTAAPHSGSPFEIVGSTGFALVVLALALLSARVLRWPLFPVTAVGQLALTAYTAHIVVVAILGGLAEEGATMVSSNGLEIYFWFVLSALIACSLWVVILGRGPLESLLSAVSRRAASFAPRLDGQRATSDT